MPEKQNKSKIREGQSVINWLPLLTLAFKNPFKKKKQSKKLSFLVFLRRLKTALPAILILAGLGGTIYFGLSYSKVSKDLNSLSTFSPPAADIKAQKPTKTSLKPSKPTHIKANSVGIDADIIVVGKQKDGTMETPGLFSHKAGWYKFSPTPGEIGPSIIVAHVDTYKGPSVFFRLKELKKGDIIQITREDKKTLKFKVEGLEQFDQKKFPTKKVYGNINKAGLRLITCGGTFNRQTGHYTENTVVFATLVTK